MPDSTPPPYNPHSTPKSNRISVDMLMQAFYGAWTRFPVTVVFILLTTLWTVFYINNYDEVRNSMSENVVAALWYFCCMGLPLTLAVGLWCEYFGRDVRVPMAVAVSLLLADAIYIMVCGSELSTFWTIGRLAIATSLIVGVIFVPTRESWAWNFSNAQVGAILLATLFSCGFSIAVSIIFGTISMLFGIDDFSDTYLSILAIADGTIPSILFLHLIPRKQDVLMHEHTFTASKFQCGTAKYFFLMLTVVYMCILYVYGLKILFTWELPRGVVSWSVTGLTVAMLLTMFLLEGVRRTHPEDRMTARALRLLPVAMVPLFVLMSVGVLYRIGEYGLTASRLYVLTFNVWCYLVAAYLILAKVRRYNLVAISFAVIFLITSIFPYFNYTSLTDSIMQRELKEALVKVGFTEFPVGEKEFVEVYKGLPKRQRIDIESKVKYLDRKDDHSLLSGITEATYYSDEKSEYISGYFTRSYYDDTTDETVVNGEEQQLRFATDSEFVMLPDGYRAVLYQKWHGYNIKFNKAEGFVTINNVSFDVPVDSLMSLDPSVPFKAVTLAPRSGCNDTIYVARTINIDCNPDEWDEGRKIHYLDMTGYILIK